jgi:hypothetical protein
MHRISRLLLTVTCLSSPGIVGPGSVPAAGLHGEDEKILRAAGIAVDGPSLLGYFRKRSLTAEQRGRIRELIPRLGDDGFAMRQRASLELLGLGPAALGHLRAARGNPDEEIKERLRAILGELEKHTRPSVSCAAARLLRNRAPAGAVEVLLGYLPEAEDDSVAEEVLCTLAVLGVNEGKVAPALIEARADREPARRAAAALVLGRSGNREQRAMVQALLTDTRPLVRFRAAQGLLAGSERAAIPTLIALIGEGPAELAARADELLRCVAGAHAPPLAPDTTPLARRRCHAAWVSWWRFNAHIDLRRAEVDLPAFNLALRCRRTAWQFLTAYRRGDREALKKLVEMPFLFGGDKLLAQPGDLEKQLEDQTARFVAPANVNQPPLEWDWTARNLDNGVRKVSAAEQAFLARFRRGEVRAVEILTQAPTPGVDAQGIIVLLRASGDRLRVVGFDPSRCLPMLLGR